MHQEDVAQSRIVVALKGVYGITKRNSPVKL
jgi:hypothetical protein